MECQKIIIDCDAGSDDALAIAMLIAAQKYKKVEILAITCVNGNTHVDNVVNNVFRTLKVCNALDIPVYKGADSPFLLTENAKVAKLHAYHGSDGFGDVFKNKPDISKLKEEHAVCALQRITAQYYGKVSVVCLGPLTNIALALRMYSDFANSVKKFLIMGGNSSGVGNITSQAEFNFYCDPESVHILIHSATNKLWLLPWETCVHSKIDVEWRNNVFGKIDSPIVKFINTIENGVYSSKEFLDYIPCDVYVAALLLRSDLVKNVGMHHIDIELHGLRTRGQIILDHMKFNKPNAHIIHSIDTEIFKNLLLFTANPSIENSSILL